MVYFFAMTRPVLATLSALFFICASCLPTAASAQAASPWLQFLQQQTTAVSQQENALICAALDIQNNCPRFISSQNSRWQAVADDQATGNIALRIHRWGCISFTQNKPFILSFDWRVSSQKKYDFLYYYANSNKPTVKNSHDIPGQRISGITPYTRVDTVFTGTGDNTADWCFIKATSTAEGDDAGWLDRFVIVNKNGIFAQLPPTISKGQSATLTVNGIALTSPTTILFKIQAQGINDAYTPIPTTIAFSPPSITLPAGNSTHTVNVQVHDDGLANLAIDAAIHITAQSTHPITINTPTFTIPRNNTKYAYSSSQNANICAALDIDNNCPQFFVSQDSHAPWTIVTDNKATGNQALQSGVIARNQRSCIGFTKSKPFTLSFNWRTSSDEIFDFLYYYTDGDRKIVRFGDHIAGQHISGITPYTMVSKRFIDTGDITIEWCYQKANHNYITTFIGDDTSWLDRVSITINSNVFAQLSHTTISQGSSATLTLNATAIASTTTLLLSTQTSSNTADPYAPTPPIALSPSTITLSAGNSTHTVNVQVHDNGLANLAIDIAIHITAQGNDLLQVNTPTFTIPKSDTKYSYSSSQNTNICAALDIDNNCPQFFVSADSHAPWTIVTDNKAIGNQALQSGTIGHSQRSCIGFTQKQPLALSFNWRVSSERRFDFLYYYTNGERQTAFFRDDIPGQHISGITPYTMVRKIITKGSTIEWCYQKDKSTASGDDAGWLDGVAIASTNRVIAQLPPTINKGQSATLTLNGINLTSTTTLLLSTQTSSNTADPYAPIPTIALSPSTITLSAGNSTHTVNVQVHDNGLANLAIDVTIHITAQSTHPITINTLTFTIPKSDTKYSYSSSQNTNICAALDIDNNCPQFFVSQDSHAPWTIVTDNTATGNQALQSGVIDDDQRSCIGFTKNQPFTLSFNWRVSSQKRFDFLYYYTNGERQTAFFRDDIPGQHISGITPYTVVRKILTDTGDITIEWCYEQR